MLPNRKDGIMLRLVLIVCAKLKVKVSVYFATRVFSIIVNIVFKNKTIA